MYQAQYPVSLLRIAEQGIIGTEEPNMTQIKGAAT
jgi:hypothetical protein